jgi:N-acetylmuramoyl-L-alanine amidase
MGTITSNPDIEAADSTGKTTLPAWPTSAPATPPTASHPGASHDALQALLAFAALHDQLRRRKALASQHPAFDSGAHAAVEFEPTEQFVLDDVLQLVAQRAIAITGADGLAIALAEDNAIVSRATAGTVHPGIGARIDRDSTFSGACFRMAQVIDCNDTEADERVNREACRELGARSMVAVPLCGRRRVIGVLEAFSSFPFGFNDSDIGNLSLLAELVVAALKPEDEDRFAESAQVAATELGPVEPITPSALEPAADKQEPTPALQVEAESATAQPWPLLQPDPLPLQMEIPEGPVASPIQAPAADVGAAEVQPTPAAPTEPEFLNEQPPQEESHPRPVVILLLIAIMIGTALAAGVWWKLRGIKLENVILQHRASVLQSVPAAELQPAAPAPTAVSSANSGNQATSEAAPQDSPIAPEDLAKLPRVSGIRQWSSPESSTVVLDLEDQVQYEAHRLKAPDRICVDLHDTQLAPELNGKSIAIGDAFLGHISVSQPVAGLTRIVLETKPGTDFSVSLEPSPYRLIVAVRKAGTNPRSAVNLFPNAGNQQNALAIVVPPPTREDLQLRAHLPQMSIVVDAGHGGWDLGTVGRRGLLEKDLVLEIAQRLGKLLESRLGAHVIYTRLDDSYVPLDQRAEIANQSQADLFVSVHANYSDLPSARGVETYYTNFFSAPGSKESGSKETGSTEAGNHPAAAAPALTNTELQERVEQSRRLAASVQHSLYDALSVQNPGLRDRGVKEAGFVVLTESAMPGILAEVSFVSSPADEQKLRSDGYREEIAEALYKGIARYAASSRSVKVAGKQPLVVSR